MVNIAFCCLVFWIDILLLTCHCRCRTTMQLALDGALVGSDTAPRPCTAARPCPNCATHRYFCQDQFWTDRRTLRFGSVKVEGFLALVHIYCAPAGAFTNAQQRSAPARVRLVWFVGSWFVGWDGTLYAARTTLPAARVRMPPVPAPLRVP